MKILHVVPFIGNEASGPAYSVPALCNALQRNGCEVVLFTLAPLSLERQKSFLFEVQTFKRDSFPTPSFGASKEMYKALVEIATSIDIIHMHSLWMAQNIYVGKIAQQYNIPLVTSPRGTLSKRALTRSKWKKQIVLKLGQRKSLEISKYFHATATHEFDDINKYLKEKETFIIPNGIEIENTKYTKQNKRKKLLYLARLHPIKGIENLLFAWNAVENRFPNWDLEIVGIGNEEYVKELKRTVKNEQIERVYFLGPKYGEEKIQKYQESNLYILPSFSENFGMTVAEALSNGLPVITTKGTPWKDVVTNGCGWYINATQEAVEEVLKEALTLSNEELDRKGGDGRKWMKEKYDWNSIAIKFKNVYTKILEDERR